MKRLYEDYIFVINPLIKRHLLCNIKLKQKRVMDTTTKLNKLSEEEMAQITGGKWVIYENKWVWVDETRSLPGSDDVPPPPPPPLP